jgi:NhaP-type Na+/H+ or K+/H+ antiporter
MTEINELIFAYGLAGVVVGMITGLLLVWLLRHTYLPVNSPRGYKSA